MSGSGPKALGHGGCAPRGRPSVLPGETARARNPGRTWVQASPTPCVAQRPLAWGRGRGRGRDKRGPKGVRGVLSSHGSRVRLPWPCCLGDTPWQILLGCPQEDPAWALAN